MPTSFPAAASAAFLPKLFYTLAEFQAAGGPGKTKCYELDNLGLLELVKAPHGKVGVTAEEVRRYFASAQPLSAAKRDTSRGTAASLRSPKRARRKGA